MSEAILEVSGLGKRFGQATAVDDVSFRVATGEVVGFLGPNGAGKTTTMRMIAGFLRPDAGRVAIGGQDVAANPVAAQSMLGYLPEGAPAYGEMTPRGFLEFIAAARGLEGDRAGQAIADAEMRTQIVDVAHQCIDTLSKGFRRRVGLAQAILTDPPALVLDEPTDGLDPNQKHAVRILIRSMAAKKAILISTHLLEEVEALCTRVILIDKGRVAADDSPRALIARSRYRNAVTVDARADQVEAARDALSLFRDRAEIIESGSRHQRDDEPGVRFQLLPKGGKPLLRDVVELLAVRDISPRGIYSEPGRLDDVFRNLTTSDVPAAPRRETAA
ncbi:MAG: ABC transporter ATP-binding protein [Pseudomonadota bacterium]